MHISSIYNMQVVHSKLYFSKIDNRKVILVVKAKYR